MEGCFDQFLLELAGCFVEVAARLYGKDRTLALTEFSNPEGSFVYGEQYVYVLDHKGVILAHGANPDYVGRSCYNLTDINGKQFIQEIIASIGQNDRGHIEYEWPDPLTGVRRPKTVFFMKSNGAIICSGAYRADQLPCIQDGESFDGGSLETEDALIEAFRNMPAADSLDVPVADDAKLMVEKATAFYNINDRPVALAEFSNPDGKFVNGTQYVFALDTTGRMLAHGLRRDYIGQDFYRRTDSAGKRFIQEIVDTANTLGSGWSEHKWFNPLTSREELEIVYFNKVDGVIICSGIYSPGF